MAFSTERVQTALLDWFARNARDLPWRRTRDPYAIWISETMLQQTRVEAVLGHYARFLERFPTVRALADATEDEVLAMWSGLGYYRRARALHAAAREIVATHAEEFPRALDGALALPGVGRYTAGAVLSIAYDVRAPVVDGNVARVFARWFELSEPIGSSPLMRALWLRAEELLPAEGAGPGRGAGDWNQALMELGARVCTPTSPNCEACPVARDCGARASGREADLPTRAPKRATVDVRLETFVVRGADGALLAREREPGGRMAGMLEPPTCERPGPADELVGLWPAELDLSLVEGAPLFEITHAITHHKIRARVRAATLRSGDAAVRPPFRWVPLGISSPISAGSSREHGDHAWTGMARKILKRIAGLGIST